MRIIYLICALLLCLSPTLAQAHEVRPAFLRITETAPAQFDVSWKQPVVSGKRLRIRPTFDEICAPTPPQLERTRETVVERFSLSCDLRGGTLRPPAPRAIICALGSTILSMVGIICCL
jgi:hypothetical protein